ncbi:MAG: hypothetical protein AB1714_20930 [Acidobacteriota bacterium]
MSRREHHGLTDIRKAALKRLMDARAVLRAGRNHTRAACYLGGYAIECRLKAIAMEVFGCQTLEQLIEKRKFTDQDIYHHGLDALARELPLYSSLQRSDVWRDFAGPVNSWRVSWRYDPWNLPPEAAQTFLEAVGRVCAWIDSNRC